MMKEADAKTKWCPMVRVSQFNTTVNRRITTDNPAPQYPAPSTNCIGNECAVWKNTFTVIADTAIESGHCGLINSK